MKKSRLSRLQNEAIGSSLANQNVEKKWVEMLSKDIPNELDQEIRLQLEECRKIVHSKDELINEFQRQLRLKDQEYVNSLKKQVSILSMKYICSQLRFARQGDEIETLMNTVRKEFSDLQNIYENELNLIEVTIMIFCYLTHHKVELCNSWHSMMSGIV